MTEELKRIKKAFTEALHCVANCHDCFELSCDDELKTEVNQALTTLDVLINSTRPEPTAEEVDATKLKEALRTMEEYLEQEYSPYTGWSAAQFEAGQDTTKHWLDILKATLKARDK
jgi:hypothetical protein